MKRAWVHPEAWAALISYYLSPTKPPFRLCYRHLFEVAEANGWAPIPSEKTLRRRLDAEKPKAEQTIARNGVVTAKRRRSRP